MKTFLTESASEAAEFIKQGGIVAFPTETVYGLGANVFDPLAVEKIFRAKRRPADNPLIAHVASVEQIGDLAVEVNECVTRLIESFFPGPLTIVVKKREEVPFIATAGLETIGIRMPKNALANAFLSACTRPVVAPSANISGRPSPTTWQAVYEDLNGRIDCILQARDTQIGLESTVVECTSDVPVLLRLGAISLDELQSVVPSTVYRRESSESAIKSPGLRHKHYSPNATVRIVEHSEPLEEGNAAFIGFAEPASSFVFVSIISDVEEYAHKVFEFFRECDRRGIRTIYCETVDETGIGAALMDRIRRAADG